MKTLTRIALASLATLALALTPFGVASAQGAASAPRDDRGVMSVTLDDAQRSVVLKARSDYLTRASEIRTTYRDSVEGILDTARASTSGARLTYEIAKDAYAVTRATGGDATEPKAVFDTAAAAYRAALQSARATARPKLDAAKRTARDALEAVRSGYVAAVTTAVPNAPRPLLVPPGRGKSWISHEFGQGLGKGLGTDRGRPGRR